ncbi:MAG: excinuclease ABC subunit UvrA [Polyangiales bacterium]
MDRIEVRGARTHNLRGVDVSLPRGALIVFTGPSGSGKSSLAFDTIYAEGRRRYIEALSLKARALLGAGARAPVDSIEGLSPAVALGQRPPPRNPRSTIGTLSEVDDHLRLLFARASVAHCLRCGAEIRARTVSEIVAAVMAFPEGARASILAPVVRGEVGDHAARLDAWRREGFVRVRVDGAVVGLDELAPLDPERAHDVDVVIDRVVIRDGARGRVLDAVELALRTAEGLVRVVTADGDERVMSDRSVCAACGASLPPPEPALFSFNSPEGACPRCLGLGTEDAAADAMVLDASLSVRGGALRGVSGKKLPDALERWARAMGADLDAPWKALPPRAREEILRGDGDGFAGLLELTAAAEKPAKAAKVDDEDDDTGAVYELDVVPCAACHGARLRPEALAYSVAGSTMADLSAMPLDALADFVRAAPIEGRGGPVVDEVLRGADARLAWMLRCDLGHLPLRRPVTALSRGEAQRARLATQLGGALTGVLYVLDEPTAGLHPEDVSRLIGALRALVEQGNTVIVVEHDVDVVRAADYVVDLGPGAGAEGGAVVAQGTPQEIIEDPRSVTGPWLAPEKRARRPSTRRTGDGALRLQGVRAGSLRDLDVTIPLAAMVAVTGVSGAGKSSLVYGALAPALARMIDGRPLDDLPLAKLTGASAVKRVVTLDSHPIGRSVRSCPATAIGLMPMLRDLYATLPEARARGFKAARFSFNVKGGRCERCQGAGVLRVEMHFLPDVEVVCDACGGARYEPETLTVKWKGCSIADALAMRVDEAAEHFTGMERMRDLFLRLHDVGLGYLTLGQPASTLSGGEAQRVRLARELSRRGGGGTVYILDEPSAGLHPSDVAQLAALLTQLVEQGNTVVMAEHDVALITLADRVIDLGPGGGVHGGRIVGEGTPEEVAAVDTPTGRALRRALDGGARGGLG